MSEGVITALIAAVLVPVMQSIIESIKHKRDRREDTREDDHKMVVEDHEQIVQINGKLTIIATAQLVVLHDRLYYLLRKVRDRQYFQESEYDNLAKMYQSYMDIGDGDKDIPKLWKDIQDLPMRED